MKEKPILFSAPMVRAILEGRKTMTRRVVKTQPDNSNRIPWRAKKCVVNIRDERISELCPYGQSGDRLWVREAWGLTSEGTVCFRADEPMSIVSRWRPSIHMFRWASRIELEITGVRVERLQDISASDIEREGAITANTEINQVLPIWIKLWESINGPGSWDKNPWVWVVEFKRI